MGGDKQLGGEYPRQGRGWQTGAGNTAAGRPSEAADCGAGWERLQLASKVAAGGPSDRWCNPELEGKEIKLQTTDRKHPWGLRQQQQEKLPAS